MSESEKKIIVDEGWKEQIERERREAEQPNAQPSEDQLPPPTFEVLVSSLATQTMAALGHVADPSGQEIEVHFDYARLQIGLLEMLVEKTENNLTQDESQLLQDALHQLRMIFVATKGQVPSNE